MQWIGAYTPISLEPQAYMDRMIMCGDGVEGYENLGAEVEKWWWAGCSPASPIPTATICA